MLGYGDSPGGGGRLRNIYISAPPGRSRKTHHARCMLCFKSGPLYYLVYPAGMALQIGKFRGDSTRTCATACIQAVPALGDAWCDLRCCYSLQLDV